MGASKQKNAENKEIDRISITQFHSFSSFIVHLAQFLRVFFSFFLFFTVLRFAFIWFTLAIEDRTKKNRKLLHCIPFYILAMKWFSFRLWSSCRLSPIRTLFLCIFRTSICSTTLKFGRMEETENRCDIVDAVVVIIRLSSTCLSVVVFGYAFCHKSKFSTRKTDYKIVSVAFLTALRHEFSEFSVNGRKTFENDFCVSVRFSLELLSHFIGRRPTERLSEIFRCDGTRQKYTLTTTITAMTTISCRNVWEKNIQVQVSQMARLCKCKKAKFTCWLSSTCRHLRHHRNRRRRLPSTKTKVPKWWRIVSSILTLPKSSHFAMLFSVHKKTSGKL